MIIQHLFLLAFMVSTVVCAAGRSNWIKFKERHRKNYLTTTEETKRRKIWEMNMDAIEQHNAIQEVNYTLGENFLSDWTEHERNALKGLRHTESRTSLDGELPLSKAKISPEKVPSSLDLRSAQPANCIGPVKFQGNCGSCWAFGSNVIAEYINCRVTGQYVAFRGAMEVKDQTTDCPSPIHTTCQIKGCHTCEQNLLDCVNSLFNDYGCSGGTTAGGLSYITQRGVNNQTYYPYIGVQAKTCYQNDYITKGKLTGFARVPSNETMMRYYLINYGPLAVGIYAGRDFEYYKSGIFAPTDCQITVNHLVNIVGYGTTQAGTDYWIVRNSWGITWGVNGYMLLKRGNNMCNIAQEPYVAWLVSP